MVVAAPRKYHPAEQVDAHSPCWSVHPTSHCVHDAPAPAQLVQCSVQPRQVFALVSMNWPGAQEEAHVPLRSTNGVTQLLQSLAPYPLHDAQAE